MRVGESKFKYIAHGNDGVIVGGVQPTGLTPFTVGCTHPTKGSPVPARGIIWSVVSGQLSVVSCKILATALSASDRFRGRARITFPILANSRDWVARDN